MKSNPTLRSFLLLAGSSLLATANAHAADLFRSGGGDWDTTSTVWGTVSGGTYDQAEWNNTNLDTAVFEGTAGNITLTEGITVGGLQFDTAGYLIQSGTLTFGAAGNIVTNENATISSILAGSSAITKTGADILTNDNTYTGTTIVDGGTLIIAGSTSSTSLVTVAATATLGGSGTVGSNTTLNGTLSPGQSPGTLTFGGNLTVNNGSTYFFETGDLTDVTGMLDLNKNWTLALGGELQDGGLVMIFTYGTLAANSNLDPSFVLANLGFAPSETLALSDTGSAIVLTGVSVIPEPGTALLGGLGLLALLRRRRS